MSDWGNWVARCGTSCCSATRTLSPRHLKRVRVGFPKCCRANGRVYDAGASVLYMGNEAVGNAFGAVRHRSWSSAVISVCRPRSIPRFVVVVRTAYLDPVLLKVLSSTVYCFRQKSKWVTISLLSEQSALRGYSLPGRYQKFLPWVSCRQNGRTVFSVRPFVKLVQIFDHHGRSAAAAVADAAGTVTGIVLLQHVDQRNQNAGTGTAQPGGSTIRLRRSRLPWRHPVSSIG